MPEPVEHALECVLGIGRVGLEALAVLVLNIFVGNSAPGVLAIIDVPLIEKSDSAKSGVSI